MYKFTSSVAACDSSESSLIITGETDESEYRSLKKEEEKEKDTFNPLTH